MRKKNGIMPCLLLAAMTLAARVPAQAGASGDSARDIRTNSQHFIDAEGNNDPWVFYPQDNIKTLTSTELPGLLMIEDAGKGKDIKGVLKNPIRISDYPLPWEFQMAWLQPEAKAGEKQTNYAFGVNLAVTFSDPSTWPADRTQTPPDTHSVQLMVVRLGSYGEMYRDGVPQLRYSELNYGDPSPEVYMLWGRGDLAPNILGNWKVPYNWFGYQPPMRGQFGAAWGWSWSKVGGPAENGGLQDVRFRVRALDETKMEIGFGFGYNCGWRMRTIDVSRFGKMTGIWEIGPIIALDDWMATDLASNMGLNPPPALDPPNPEHPYCIDYAIFYGNGPENFEHLSEDYNIPGVIPNLKSFIEGDGNFETWSHPGYLTVTFSGKPTTWAMCPMAVAESTAGLGFVELDKYKPPMELEIAFIAEDDSIPWNFAHTIGFVDEEGKGHGWEPGIQNIPGKGRFFIETTSVDPYKIEKNPEISVEFEREIPQSLLTHKPVRILMQVIDDHTLRLGLKGDAKDPWLFSKPFDTSKHFKKIVKFSYPAPFSRVGLKGGRVGNYPRHLQFLIDYTHYRYGLSQ